MDDMSASFSKQPPNSEKSFRNKVINTSIIAILAILGVLGFNLVTDPEGRIFLMVVAALIFISLIFAFQGKLYPAQVITPTSLLILLAYFMITALGISDPSIIGFTGIVALAGLFFGQTGVFIFGFLTTTIIAGVGYAELNGIIVNEFSQLLNGSIIGTYLLINIASTAGISMLIRQTSENLEVAKHNEQIQIKANKELSNLKNSLEQQVVDRTLALEQRSAYLEGSAEISQAAASILESDALIRQVVELIKDRFELYYVGLFLVDEKNEWAVLQADTGEPGRKMLARNHRLKIGEGMIGWSIANAESRIALDVGEDAVRFENPDLPETRSEGALPLRSRGRVLGALTVQSTTAAAFNQDIITTLQTMADQIAVALDNADLFAKSQAALEAERRAYGELSHEAWVALSQSQAAPGYLVTAEGAMHPIKGQQPSETSQVIQNKPIIQNDGLTVIIPIKSRGRILGGVKIRKGNDNDTWTQTEIELAETLSEQLSTALESARLYEDTQRRATRERVISEASSRMRETLDIESVLQTAAKELRKALGVAAAEVWIETDNE